MCLCGWGVIAQMFYYFDSIILALGLKFDMILIYTTNDYQPPTTTTQQSVSPFATPTTRTDALDCFSSVARVGLETMRRKCLMDWSH